MSFTQQVVEELHTVPIGKSCCQKSFLCGLLFACQKEGDNKIYKAFFYRKEDAQRAAELIDQRFSTGVRTELEASTRGGHRGWRISFSSKALMNIFRDIDDREGSLDDMIGFRCEECKRAFLRGVFISCAAINSPQRGYHLEFSAYGEARADLLEKLLGESICEPKRIVRKNKIGLYYKSNSEISDILYYLKASKAGLDIANSFIEKDIRNIENRATNCVTSNISRTVDATRKYIEAINFLIEREKLVALGDDLTYTAMLRLENDSASLSELARLHQPPISKSGLNGRLSKILMFAEEVRKSSDN